MTYNELYGLNDEYEIAQFYMCRPFEMVSRELPINYIMGGGGLYQNSNAYFIGYTNISELESLEGCFMNVGDAEVIDLRDWDFSKVYNIRQMFQSCSCKVIIFGEHPELNVNNMDNMFYSSEVYKVDLRGVNTSNVTTYSCFLAFSSRIKELYGLDFSSVTNPSNLDGFFYIDTDLVHTDGFKNMRVSWADDNGLARCPYLSKQSCLNIIENLYDFTANGETPNSDEGVVKVHRNFINKLTEDEINSIVAKGWQLIY
jgi:hypothetical protein